MIELLTYRDSTAKVLLPHLEYIYAESQNISVGNLLNAIKNNKFSGWASVMLDEGEIISCAAIETSEHYTGDSDSLRFCRYYKMKNKRKIKYNVYPYLNTYVHLGLVHGFKVLYFTVFNQRVFNDIRNIRTSAIYKNYLEEVDINDFQLRTDVLFKLADDCVQYVYEYKLDGEYEWNPNGKFIIPYNSYTEEEIAEIYKHGNE